MVIRLGGFHIALNYLAVLGKRFKDSGIEDLLIESSVYGSCTASALLHGKSYNRGVRAHKLLMEAMLRLQWQSFIDWLKKKDQTGGSLTIDGINMKITECRENINSEENLTGSFQHLLQGIKKAKLLFDEFKTEGASRSNIFAFCN